MRILITGANGQLGSEIRALTLFYPKFNFFFANSQELNICNYKSLRNYASQNLIEVIINCAAYTAVDKAENNIEIATQINDIGVENIVKVIQAVNGRLIHISTDYVFNGNHFHPYLEEDLVSPIGVYGKTKRSGEEKVLNADINSIVIRTSWLYSSFGTNFVKTMLRLGKERAELGVVFDQVGTPTYAKDLAVACLEILSKEEQLNKKSSLYHFSNEGVASCYDFAKAIMQISSINCSVKPIESKDYPTIAERPFYSVLNKSKIKSHFQIQIPYWRDSLQKCISQLQ